MSAEDDDLLREFLAESREHLAGIETDLLAIEEAGANVDESLVNKVFRAAHSIKGGSGFFDLKKIQELAHKTETVLSLIRSREILPNPEIVNILLQAFDKLRDLINHPAESHEADISDHVTALTAMTSTFLPKKEKPSLNKEVSVAFDGTTPAATVPEFDLLREKAAGHTFFLLDYDLIHDVERQGRTPLTVMKDLSAHAQVVDASINLEAVGSLDDTDVNLIPFQVIVTSALDRSVLAERAGLDEKKVHSQVDPKGKAKASGKQARKSDVESAPVTPLHAPPVAVGSAASVSAPAPAPVAVVAPEQDVQAPSPLPVSTAAPSQEKNKPAAVSAEPAEMTLRVNVNLLENLMNLAGELVLSRNQLRESLGSGDRRAMTAASQRINWVTSELQEAIMRTRLQPINNVFGKFPRLVRDLARDLKKQVTIEIEGKDVELDKTLIEGLSDPLTHMVRNSVDHGVERPEERAKAGKKPGGIVRLRAAHEAGQVVIEIADDGKGIDPVRVAESALRKGLISAEKLQAMSDKDKMALIFLPGLSTATVVTGVSGRGVGMDVVKTNLNRLGGKIEIESQPGKGTVFRIKLPLTLAIIPSLIVSEGDERFAIPQVNVVELIRVPAEKVRDRVEVVGDAPVLRLRGELIPLVRLADGLDRKRTYVDPETGQRSEDRRVSMADRRSKRFSIQASTLSPQSVSKEKRQQSEGRRAAAASDLRIVILTSGLLQYGLIVQELHNTEEIVVKPLGRHLKHLQEYAGATIMGDGQVALILDPAGLAAKADLAAVSGAARAREVAEQEDREKREDVLSLLLFHNAPDEVCAVPLGLVQRLERISIGQVEMTGGRRTMQYRGVSLPLVVLGDAARVKTLQDDQERVVLVVNVNGKDVGLLGALPVDVTEARLTVDRQTLRQKGIAGSAILREKTIMLVDIHELVKAAWPDLMDAPPRPVEGGPTILLAEDSDFFRAQVKKYLTEEGYTVLDAPDGEDAWALLRKHAEQVKAVVTDIEMPRLGGLGFAQRIRADGRFARLPIIAVTSLAAEEDVARGKAAGIDDYQVKLDRDRLLQSLRGFLTEARS